MECTLHRVFWKSLDPLKEGFTTKEDAIGHLKKIPLGILVRAGIKDIKDMSFIHFDNL